MIGNRSANREHSDNIVEISKNTEKSSGDLKRLGVTWTPLKKPSANAGVEKTQGIIMIIIMQ